MKLFTTIAFGALALSLTSCATPQPRQVYNNLDRSALVIRSLDNDHGQIMQPTLSAREDLNQIMAAAQALPGRRTAVIILDNYAEPQLGRQFCNRTTPWFVGLRALGYRHIVFLQGRAGQANANPGGLVTLAEYR